MLLQVASHQAIGYIDPKAFTSAQRTTQPQQVCNRCRQLRSGAMVPGVEDVTQRAERETCENSDLLARYRIERSLTSAEQIRARLKVLRSRYAFVILLVDVSDAEGSLLPGVRSLVAANPVLLVGTKADLVPEGTDPEAVERWLAAMAKRTGLSPIGVRLVSGRTGQGVAELLQAIHRQHQGRDVYLLGAANVGKSALVRAMVDCLGPLPSKAKYYPRSGAASGSGDGGGGGEGSGRWGRVLPTESPMPGTTLDMIAVAPLPGGGLLFDTPGVHVPHRLLHHLPPAELRALSPLSPLNLQHLPLPSRSSAAPVRFFWSDVARLDVLMWPEGTALAAYTAPGLPLVPAPPLQWPAAKPVGPGSAPGLDAGPSSQQPRVKPFTGGSALKLDPGPASLGPWATRSGRGSAQGLSLALEVRHHVPKLLGRGTALAVGAISVSGMPGWVTVHVGPDVGSHLVAITGMKVGSGVGSQPVGSIRLVKGSKMGSRSRGRGRSHVGSHVGNSEDPDSIVGRNQGTGSGSLLRPGALVIKVWTRRGVRAFWGPPMPVPGPLGGDDSFWESVQWGSQQEVSRGRWGQCGEEGSWDAGMVAGSEAVRDFEGGGGTNCLNADDDEEWEKDIKEASARFGLGEDYEDNSEGQGWGPGLQGAEAQRPVAKGGRRSGIKGEAVEPRSSLPQSPSTLGAKAFVRRRGSNGSILEGRSSAARVILREFLVAPTVRGGAATDVSTHGGSAGRRRNGRKVRQGAKQGPAEGLGDGNEQL